MNVLVLQGPNLDQLGRRDAEHYGTFTLADVEAALNATAVQLGVRLTHVQSNHEGVLIDTLHATTADAIVVNAAAYTHTSIALRDAFALCSVPFVEVHISNVYAREPFRHRSLLADLASGVVCGFGIHSYTLALRGVVDRVRFQGCTPGSVTV